MSLYLSYLSANVFRFVENSVRQLVRTFQNDLINFYKPFCNLSVRMTNIFKVFNSTVKSAEIYKKIKLSFGKI